MCSTNDMVQVQRSGLSEESQILTRGESLCLGQTKARTAQEGL
jgi:hypothetical protein